MNFRFDAEKATPVAAGFTQREGGGIRILKRVQLSVDTAAEMRFLDEMLGPR
jgi:hypothetical protein